MYFDINESYTSSFCIQQANFCRIQMKKIDTEISYLTEVLKSIPSWDSPSYENYELVNALSNKIENLSNYADNIERSVDYWEIQKLYALKRENVA